MPSDTADLERQLQLYKGLVEVSQGKDKNEMFAKLREETRDRIKAILNDEQETRVRELAGPVFNGEIVFEEDN